MRGVSLRRQHLPGLDGVRALAVLSVLAYHLGYGWAQGGFLGVDLFFVLSGFLITTLLLEEKIEDGRVSLTAFWGRRARRLLPALFVMIAAVVSFPAIITHLGHPGGIAGIDLTELRGFAVSSFFYVANWYAIISSHSYFAQFAAPSPLAHTWSLAIEEQFYLVWPLVIVAITAFTKGSLRRRGVAVCVALAVLSSGTMAVLYHGNAPDITNYVYNATFTRLFDLAVGAALAFLVVRRDVSALWAKWSTLVGGAALVALVAAMSLAGEAGGLPRRSMYYGGFLACASLGAIVIAAVRVEDSFFARVFSWRPLRAIGQVSYGIYLWHYPVIVYVTPRLVHVTGAGLLVIRLLAIAGFTVASYFLIEQPIRLRRWPVRVRRIVFPAAGITTLALAFVMTSSSLFPLPVITQTLVRYAPSSPPQGSGGIEGVVSTSYLDAHHFSEKNRLRVMVMGDSLAYYSSPGLNAMMKAMPDVTGVVQAGVGLGLRDPARWSFYLDAVSAFHPQVAIFMEQYDKTVVQTNVAAYERQFTGFLHALRAHNVDYFVLASTPNIGPPIARSLSPAGQRAYAAWGKRITDAWNSAAQAVQAANPDHVLYAPLGESVEYHGQYASWLPPPRDLSAARPTWDRVRMNDGTHLCSLGTETYGAALGTDIATMFHVRGPQGAWWLGKWPYVTLPEFAPNPSWCPIDHPSGTSLYG